MWDKQGSRAISLAAEFNTDWREEKTKLLEDEPGEIYSNWVENILFNHSSLNPNSTSNRKKLK